jgi:mitochondrial intermediate peptidase
MLARTARNALLKSPFRFRGCLHAKRNVVHAASRPASTLVTLPASVDDKALVSLFDQPKNGFKSSPFAYSGIFGHPTLITPDAFTALADATLLRAQLLTERILRARESRDELFKVVKNLDRLSDMLCSVIDLAELVRNAHPDRFWVVSANEAYEKLCEFMNVLNTHVGLYEVCKLFYHVIFLADHIDSGSESCSFGPYHCQITKSGGVPNSFDILARL